MFNERPTREEQTIATATPIGNSGPSPLANSATIHTTLGDIHMRLFPQQAPKTVENFVGHARSSYFEGVIFHRVIPKFMIQTGDPLGDGTGGTSIWGREFEDEFHDDLRHDRWVQFRMYYGLPLTSLLPCKALHCQHGQCGARHKRIAIFHHYDHDAMAGQEAHHLWAGDFWAGSCPHYRECESEQNGQTIRGHQDYQHPGGMMGYMV